MSGFFVNRPTQPGDRLQTREEMLKAIAMTTPTPSTEHRGAGVVSDDPDFGAPHKVAVLVEDDRGTQTVAFYEHGTWWEGHPNEDRHHQTVTKPVKLVEPRP